jgi:type II secretory pathway pseudopilin PulG
MSQKPKFTLLQLLFALAVIGIVIAVLANYFK